MIIHDCKQGSTEWLAKRAGIVTASEFDALVTPTFKARTGKGPETYLYLKLAEKCMGIPQQFGGSAPMEQGNILENEAIPFYSFHHNVEIKRVGFVTTDDGRYGCSPDGLIGDDGGIEIKCPLPGLHLKYLVKGEVPEDYIAQVHFSMFVTGRPWWIFNSYNRQFPPLVLRVDRDEKIQTAIREAADAFMELFDSKLIEVLEMRKSGLVPPTAMESAATSITASGMTFAEAIPARPL